MILKNIGIQLKNISSQVQKMGMQISNINQYFGFQIQYMSNQISNIAIQIFNIGMQIPDSNQKKENFGIQKFNMRKEIQEMNNINPMKVSDMELNNNNFINNINNIDDISHGKIISILFINSKGQVNTITVSNEVTVEQLLNLYIAKIGENHNFF